MYIRVTKIGLNYVADPSIWPKKQGCVGQSSGAFQRLHVLVLHAQGMTSGQPGGTYLHFSAPVSVEWRIANMVARIRDQMWKEVLEYASCMRVISIRTVERWQLSVAADSFELKYWLSAGSLPRKSAGGLTDRLITTIALWVRL